MLRRSPGSWHFLDVQWLSLCLDRSYRALIAVYNEQPYVEISNLCRLLPLHLGPVDLPLVANNGM